MITFTPTSTTEVYEHDIRITGRRVAMPDMGHKDAVFRPASVAVEYRDGKPWSLEVAGPMVDDFPGQWGYWRIEGHGWADSPGELPEVARLALDATEAARRTADPIGRGIVAR